MKKVRCIAVVIALLLVGALISVPLWVDSVASAAVESGAQQALGVPTSLSGIDVGLFSADCSLEGLAISNPAEFEDQHFLELDRGYVSVSVGSLMGDEVEVPELTLRGMRLNLERKTTKSNYGRILEHVKAQESDRQADAEGKRFVIRKVTIRDIEVTSRFSLAGIPRPAVKLKIPEISFENLGSDSGGGVVLSTLMREILKATLAGVVDAGKGVLPDDIAKGLGQGLKGLEGAGRFGLKVVGEGGKVLGGVAKGVGGLFGGKKKQD